MIAFSLMVLFIVKTLSVRITDAFLLYRVKVRIVSLLTKYNEKKIRIPDVASITRISYQFFLWFIQNVLPLSQIQRKALRV